ncbi:MAG TPA: C4-type zinc ribbon domain-containing protein [Vicinamibacterales bacterium]|nr:C4-type zinc ribbon domain-containing protein [Vicinamibacterales bacterium]
MLQALTSLIALQTLDSAADAARRRLSEFPAAEQALAAKVAAVAAEVEAAKTAAAANHTARRALEKDVAAVDARLAKFDDHKAAVKTNHEYTALLHEISTAKTDKDALEEKILVLMDEADGLAAAVKSAESALAAIKKEGDAARAAMARERGGLDAELARLAGERAREASAVEAPVLAKYEQLLKGRRGIAVARMDGELCTACHVRLRPHVTQQVRRNDAIVQCDSCQRILYFTAPAAAAGATA